MDMQHRLSVCCFPETLSGSNVCVWGIISQTFCCTVKRIVLIRFVSLQTVGTAAGRMCVAGQANGSTPTQTVTQLCASINSRLPNQLPSVSGAVTAICGSTTTQVGTCSSFLLVTAH